MIPKKKVKGNEASVWGEMEVLKDLDHPNIVRGTSILALAVTYHGNRSNFTNGSNRAPNTTSPSSWLLEGNRSKGY